MQMKTSMPSGVPQFALYGEQARNLDPEFVHIEAIADRSVKHDWVIRPHRHAHLLQVLHMSSGAMELQLEDAGFTLHGRWATVIPNGVAHGFRFHPGTQGMVLSVATNLFGVGSDSRSEALLKEMTTRPQVIDFGNDSALHPQLKQYLELIQRELANPFEDQHLVLYSLLKVVLMTLRRQLHRGQLVETDRAGLQLSNKFRVLLEKHYYQHWKVGDYARQLNISVSTLNRLCHQAFGASAKATIRERLLVEAKRKLIYTVDTLETIGYELGFKDPAYFSRFFRRNEGVSPKSFRLSLRGE